MTHPGDGRGMTVPTECTDVGHRGGSGANALSRFSTVGDREDRIWRASSSRTQKSGSRFRKVPCRRGAREALSLQAPRGPTVRTDRRSTRTRDGGDVFTR